MRLLERVDVLANAPHIRQATLAFPDRQRVLQGLAAPRHTPRALEHQGEVIVAPTLEPDVVRLVSTGCRVDCDGCFAGWVVGSCRDGGSQDDRCDQPGTLSRARVHARPCTEVTPTLANRLGRTGPRPGVSSRQRGGSGPSTRSWMAGATLRSWFRCCGRRRLPDLRAIPGRRSGRRSAARRANGRKARRRKAVR